nr:TraR/DksA family transcriptional regulator [uncultured Pseudodesulfovibrio sp.]
MTKTQIKEIRMHLVQGLHTMTDQEITDVLAVENCPDDTDFASQLAQHGLNVSMQCRRIKRIREMENALRRLVQSDYGMCEECGEEIGVARLKANPLARLCVSCQSAAEEGLTRCA